MGNDDIHIWVRVFLVVFLLVGLLPHFHKSLFKIADYLRNLRRSTVPGVNASAMDQETTSAVPARMGDIEHLIFTRLAQAGTKGMSLNTIAETLHMDRSMIRKPLQTLNQRGFVRVAPGLLFTRRLTLSDKGRAIAVSEGLIPKVSHKNLF